MSKDEIIKGLEELRDIKDYSQSELLNTGYRTAILDAIDLVKKLTIPVLSNQRELLIAYEIRLHTEIVHFDLMEKVKKKVDDFLSNL